MSLLSHCQVIDELVEAGEAMVEARCTDGGNMSIKCHVYRDGHAQ